MHLPWFSPSVASVLFFLGMATHALSSETRTIVFFGDSLTAGYGLIPRPSHIRR
jgi:hypothetical protein